MAPVFASAVVSLLLVSCAATDDATAAVQTRVSRSREPVDVPELTDPDDIAVIENRNLRTGSRMAPLVSWLLSHQKYVNVIDVGVGESGFGAGRDTPYDTVLLQPNVYGLLMEPNPKRVHVLNNSIHNINWDVTPRFTLLDYAVTGDHPYDFAELEGKADAANYEIKNTTKFYTVSAKLFEDYPNAPKWLETEVGSLHNETVLAYHDQVEKADGTQLSKEEFEEYLEEIEVKNKVPKDVLADAGISAWQIDILKTSAEGSDAEVIKAFFTLSGFRPTIVQFNVGTDGGKNWDRPGHMDYLAMVDLITTLTLFGYRTDCIKETQMWTCPNDAMAWHLHKSAYGNPTGVMGYHGVGANAYGPPGSGFGVNPR